MPRQSAWSCAAPPSSARTVPTQAFTIRSRRSSRSRASRLAAGPVASPRTGSRARRVMRARSSWYASKLAAIAAAPAAATSLGSGHPWTVTDAPGSGARLSGSDRAGADLYSGGRVPSP